MTSPAVAQAVGEEAVLSLLRSQYNLDFTHYKPATVRRRLARRLEFRQLPTLADYAALLATDKQELDLLYQDLLIGVTEFFRDPAVFSFLESQTIPGLFKDRRKDEEVRVWCAACATGEEAYSIAMLLCEQAAAAGHTGPIKVFATDVHRGSLEAASRGIYPMMALNPLSEARKQRYFTRVDAETVRVDAALRRMLVFASHNLLNDAPFTHIDLVCCRNLLIYLLPAAQKRLLANLQFSLRPGGTLVLGSSERPGTAAGGFEVVDQACRVYRRLGDRTPAAAPARPPGVNSRELNGQGWQSPVRSTVALDRQLSRDYDILFARHLPPGLLVDEQRHVLHFFGDVEPYLKRLRGRAEQDVLKLVTDKLASPLRTVLHQAMKSRNRAVSNPLKIQSPAGALVVVLAAEGVFDEAAGIRHYHISFTAPQRTVADCLPVVETSNPRRVEELEQELHVVRDNLELSIEELQNSNERLDLTNEELNATNEELHSTNEEIKSVNEDLHAVNAELEVRNRELRQLNRDHDNLLASIDIGTMFLDRQLCIRKFSPAMRRHVQLMAHDIGRPIDHLAWSGLDGAQLLADARALLADETAREREFPADGGTWLLARTLPFRGETGQVEGVVLTLTDITGIKQAELKVAQLNAALEQTVAVRTEALQQSNQRLEGSLRELQEAGQKLQDSQTRLAAILDSISDGFFSLDENLVVTYFNPASERLLRRRSAEVCGRQLFEAFPEAKGTIYDVMYTRALREKIPLTFETHFDVEPYANWYDVRVYPFPDGISVYFQVTTERKQAEAAAQRAAEELSRFFDLVPDLLCIADQGGHFLRLSPAWEQTLGYSRAELEGRRFLDFVHPDDVEPTLAAMAALANQQGVRNFPNRYRCRDGSWRWLEWNSSPAGELTYAAARDVTDRRRAETALAESQASYRQVVSSAPWGMHFYEVNAAGELLFTGANAAADRILRMEHADLLGKPILLAFPGLTGTDVPDTYLRVAATGVVWHADQVVYDQGRIQGAFEVTAFQTAPGQMVAAFVDITDRKRAEMELRDSEARHRALISVLPDLVFILDRQGIFKDYHCGTTGTLFLPPEQFLDRSMHAVLPPSLAAGLQQIIARVFAGGGLEVLEYDLPMPDGRRDYEARVMRYTDTTVLCVIRDISDRKRAEELLLQRLHTLTQPAGDTASIRFQDLFDLEEIQRVQDAFAAATGVASIITDTEGNPITRPSRFCRLCRDIIRKNEKGLQNCICSDAALGRLNPDGPIMQPCLSGGLWDGGSSIMVGDRHIANWLIGQVLDDSIDQERMLAYGREIGADETVFRQALAEVTRMPRDQFSRVCDALFLTARQLSRLATQNVQQARHISERVQFEQDREHLLQELAGKNRELENIVYVTSHDLRAPLVNLEGFGSILEQECTRAMRVLRSSTASEAELRGALDRLAERLPKCVGYICGSSRKMNNLVNGLLQVSRTGRAALKPVHLDMNAEMAAVISVVAYEIQTCGATVTADPLPPCRGDAVQINQVFANLLSNALKYRHPARPPVIQITGERQGAEVVYTVRDNGIGVAAAYHERIWKLFVRLNPENPVQGDGLGLALVKLIVERHHGRCWVESVEGEGSVFHVALPAG